MNELQERFLHSLWGVVLGDVLGVPFQFGPRYEHLFNKEREEAYMNLANQNIAHMQQFYGYDFKLGVYSDDTAMTLATIAGIYMNDGELPMNDKGLGLMINCFVDWYKNNAYTQYGAWDIGKTTDNAMVSYVNELKRAEWQERPVKFLLSGDTDPQTAGNGSLMRMMPIVFMLYLKDGVKSLEKFNNLICVDNISSITHATQEVINYCFIYTEFMLNILDGQEKNNALTATLNFFEKRKNYFNLGEIRIFNKDFKKLQLSEIKSSGYIVDTLEAATWCFLNTDNFEDCILAAVSLGEDTDTIASIAGGIAGAYYKTHNERWEQMVMKPEFIQSAIKRFMLILK